MLKAVPNTDKKPNIDDLHLLMHEAELLASIIDAVVVTNITAIHENHESHVALLVELIHERLNKAADMASELLSAGEV